MCDGTDDSARDRFKALYDQHYPAVLRYAARRIDAEGARDVAAETFLTAWRRLDSVPSGAALPWLYATARKCLANELRRQARRERLDARIRAEAGRGDMTRLELSERVADRLVVLAALATLGPLDQEALRLIEWEQLDIAGAAQAMGCSTGPSRSGCTVPAAGSPARSASRCPTTPAAGLAPLPQHPSPPPERRSSHETHHGRRVAAAAE